MTPQKIEWDMDKPVQFRWPKDYKDWADAFAQRAAAEKKNSTELARELVINGLQDDQSDQIASLKAELSLLRESLKAIQSGQSQILHDLAVGVRMLAIKSGNVSLEHANEFVDEQMHLKE